MSTVTLQPIAMVTPNHEGIYAPSRLRKKKKVSYRVFLARYADYSRAVQVSFEPDGKSKPRLFTAYGYGLDCWYLAF